MKCRDFIREAVLRTNPYRPFSSLNKVPYNLAIEAFVRLCGKFPEITSAYLRGSLVNMDWVPALSDVDVTIIIDDQLTLVEEYSFLRSFWKAHDQLKRVFPMLGETEIFDGGQFRIITKFGILGYRSVTWQLIYGEEIRNFNAQVGLKRSRVDPINYALQFYLGPFLRGITKAKSESYLVIADLGRLASKILRTLELIGPQGEIEHFRGQPRTRATLLGFVMEQLDKCIGSFNRQRLQGGGGTERMQFNDITAANNVNFERLDLDQGWRQLMERSVDSVVVNYRREGFIVLRKEAEPAALGKSLVDMRGLLGLWERDCSMATQRIFEYMLRYYNPFQYTGLVEHRSLLWGRDVVSDVEPPDKYCFENFLVTKVKNVLHFARNHDLILAEGREVFASTSLTWVMNTALVIKLYLEKKILIPSYRRAWLEGRQQYPEYEARRRELWERSSEMSLEALSWEWHRLLKTLGNDLQKCLADI
jgi:hypothetical protein